MTVVFSPSLIVFGVPELPPFPLVNPRIGYQSLANESNVTASSEEAEFPAIAVVNPLTYDLWQPLSVPAWLLVSFASALPVDYIGIAAHNFGTIDAEVVIEHSTDALVWTEHATLSPVDNSPIMVLSATVNRQYWRMRIATTNGIALPQVGVFYIGEALAMQRSIYGGLTPPTMARVTEYETNESQTNNWLGRTVKRMGTRPEVPFKNLTASWYREYFEPFVKAARTRPFFIAWNPEEFPSEVAYTWTVSDIVPTNNGTRDLMDVTLQLKGWTDE